MKELAEDYFAYYANKSKRPKSLRLDHQMLDRLILPEVGHLAVAAVSRRDIERLHATHRKTPYQANRVLALLSKMFSLANQWHSANPVWRTDNPVKGIKRFQEERRERWLKKEEVERLIAALAEHPNRNAVAALLLILLTGSRKTEALSATWSQFDLGTGIWTKPSAHTKQKRVEHVPLNAPALALLVSLRSRATGGDCVFPGRGDFPLRDLKGPWKDITRSARLCGTRIHDLRHTFASYLVSSGTPIAVVGKLLGHTQSATTERYAHLADTPVREAAEAFGKLFSWPENEPQSLP